MTSATTGAARLTLFQFVYKIPAVNQPDFDLSLRQILGAWDAASQFHRGLAAGATVLQRPGALAVGPNFPPWWNKLPIVAAIAGSLGPTLAIAGVWYFFSPWYTDVGYRPVQPVPYSHKLHVGELGLDCRYCHASVEISAVANVPPTQTCMNCHQTVKRDSALLAPIRDSAQSGRPMRWIRVHNLPDYAYFAHKRARGRQESAASPATAASTRWKRSPR